VLAGPAGATPGALDSSFSGNGIQTIFTGGATAQAVAIDAQDRILVAGYTFGANPRRGGGATAARRCSGRELQR